MYNYREALKEDIRSWMNENQEKDYDAVFEGCWIADEVTGNGSGSYTFNRQVARQYFFEDIYSDDYIFGMIQDGMCTAEEIGNRMAHSDWEWIDVSIRCYLLSEVVQEVLDEMNI